MKWHEKEEYIHKDNEVNKSIPRTETGQKGAQMTPKEEPDLKEVRDDDMMSELIELVKCRQDMEVRMMDWLTGRRSLSRTNDKKMK